MSHQEYGKASYWDERYTNEPEIFDWYQVCEGVVIAPHHKRLDARRKSVTVLQLPRFPSTLHLPLACVLRSGR